MDKKILISMLAVFVSCQAFGQTATFNATTFGSSEFENADNSGNSEVNISAEWQPNTINVSYDLNGGTGSVSGAGTTCTYGETINLPKPVQDCLSQIQMPQMQ